MIYLIKAIYQFCLVPPGLFIIILVLLSIYLYRKKDKYYKVLSIFTLIFYLCCTSFFADMVIRPLEKAYSPPIDPKGDVIIALGGGALGDTPNVNSIGTVSGNAANRLLCAAQLYQYLKVPILVSGGQVYSNTGTEAAISKNILIGLGVPEDMIITEAKSLNTSENAKYSSEILADNEFKKPILVTSAFHMKRAVREFKKYKVNVIPYPCDYQTNISGRIGLQDFLPQGDAIEKLSVAVKEYIGIAASGIY